MVSQSEMKYEYESMSHYIAVRGRDTIRNVRRQPDIVCWRACAIAVIDVWTSPVVVSKIIGTSRETVHTRDIGRSCGHRGWVNQSLSVNRGIVAITSRTASADRG